MKQANKQIGGFARSAALSPERRKEIAVQAVTKRWAIYDREQKKKAGTNPALGGVEAVTPQADTSACCDPLPT